MTRHRRSPLSPLLALLDFSGNFSTRFQKYSLSEIFLDRCLSTQGGNPLFQAILDFIAKQKGLDVVAHRGQGYGACRFLFLDTDDVIAEFRFHRANHFSNWRGENRIREWLPGSDQTLAYG